MAIFMADKKAITLTIHKENCPTIPREKLQSCGCGNTGDQEDQCWYCEEHITEREVIIFMEGRYWPAILCEMCFRDGQKPQ